MSAITATPIHTDRLTLLPLRAEHADELAAALSHPDPATGAATGPTAEGMRIRYGRMAAGHPDPAVCWRGWVAQVRDGACLTGWIQAMTRLDDRGSVSEVDWHIGSAWHQRDIATEAVGGLVAWLRQASVRSVIIRIDPDDPQAAETAAAAGFTVCDWDDELAIWRKRLKRPQ